MECEVNMENKKEAAEKIIDIIMEINDSDEDVPDIYLDLIRNAWGLSILTLRQTQTKAG